MKEKKHFIKISSDDIEAMRELWFNNEETFSKFICDVQFDKETGKICSKEWCESIE